MGARAIVSTHLENAALNAMSRRFPPPWTVEDIGAAFVVRDHNGQAPPALPEPMTALTYEVRLTLKGSRFSSSMHLLISLCSSLGICGGLE
jgi:hypothetical protein